MLINRLRLMNFRQHEDTELVFGAGLTGIIGPNGAGKTTLLEAIAWAMYGAQAARGGRDTIRRRGAPPRAKVEVELDFTLGAHQYRIVRGLGSAALYQDGAPGAIANSLGAVTERVTRMLGMTREEFFNTYFTGQKELAVMAAMSAPERAQFLSRVLGYEKLRTAQERLKDRRTALRGRHEALQHGLPDAAQLDAELAAAEARSRTAAEVVRVLAARLDAAERAVAEVRPKWEQAQRARESAAGLDAERRVAEADLRAAIEKESAARRRSEEAAAARAALEVGRADVAALVAMRAEHTDLERASQAYHAKRGAMAQVEEVRGRIVAAEGRIGALPSEGAAAAVMQLVDGLRAEHAEAAARADERRIGWVRDRQDAATQLRTLRAQYQDLKEQRDRIVSAGHDGSCPTCARPLHDEFDHVMGLLDRQLEELTNNGQYFRLRVEQLEAEPPDLIELERGAGGLQSTLSGAVADLARAETWDSDRRNLELERVALGARLAELEKIAGATATAYDFDRHAEVRAALAALEPVALSLSRLEGVSERAEALVIEAAAATVETEGTRARVSAIAARAAELAFTEEHYRSVRAADEQAERQRREVELELVRSRAEEASAREALASGLRRREDLTARIAEARRVGADLAVHQELDRALTDLRTDLNQTLRPELGELASSFLRDLTNGRYTDIELDESYVATLLDDGEPKLVISGGEEDIANLAIRLAISQMIADRAGQPLSLLVLDEIFGSLDEERRASVVELLRGLADRFPQVILITHIDSVRDGFDRVIRVSYDVGRGVAVARDEPRGEHDAAA